MVSPSRDLTHLFCDYGFSFLIFFKSSYLDLTLERAIDTLHVHIHSDCLGWWAPFRNRDITYSIDALHLRQKKSIKNNIHPGQVRVGTPNPVGASSRARIYGEWSAHSATISCKISTTKDFGAFKCITISDSSSARRGAELLDAKNQAAHLAERCMSSSPQVLQEPKSNGEFRERKDTGTMRRHLWRQLIYNEEFKFMRLLAPETNHGGQWQSGERKRHGLLSRNHTRHTLTGCDSFRSTRTALSKLLNLTRNVCSYQLVSSITSKLILPNLVIFWGQGLGEMNSQSSERWISSPTSHCRVFRHGKFPIAFPAGFIWTHIRECTSWVWLISNLRNDMDSSGFTHLTAAYDLPVPLTSFNLNPHRTTISP